MQVSKHRPVVAPFAWSGVALQKSIGWTRPIGRNELRARRRAAGAIGVSA